MSNEELAISNEKKFLLGLFWGFFLALVFFGSLACFYFQREQEKEFIEYVEMQREIEVMRENVANLSVDELLDAPGIRGAVDGASAEFIRKRDEAVQRIRGGLADR